MFRKQTPESRRSKQIDKELLADFRAKQEEHQILLLGTGESGKTTILKQMRLIHISEYTNDEKKAKIADIRNNIHESIHTIVENIKKSRIVVLDDIQAAIDYILSLGKGALTEYSQEYYDKVSFLWKNNAIQDFYKQGNEYHLLDSTEEFMNRLDVIRKDEYVPTTQDILYCRVQTTAIDTLNFNVDVPKKYGGGVAKFLMFDVGGQRVFRRKWISVFEDIKTVLFLISTSDFDQVLREDGQTNRLEDALNNLDNMFHSRYLQTNDSIIFLNKEDLLEKKIKNGRSIGTYFAKYKSFQQSKDEFTNTKLFIQKEIYTIVGKRNAYIHFTVATSTENIKRIFDSVHFMLIEKALKDVVPF